MSIPYCVCCTHRIWPSAQLPSYAIAKGLRSFSECMRLTKTDTFIVGPFDFTVINGHKSKDKVLFTQRKVLSKLKHLFNTDNECQVSLCLTIQCTVGNYIRNLNRCLYTCNSWHTWPICQAPIQYSDAKGTLAPNPKVVFPQEVSFLVHSLYEGNISS